MTGKITIEVTETEKGLGVQQEIKLNKVRATDKIQLITMLAKGLDITGLDAAMIGMILLKEAEEREDKSKPYDDDTKAFLDGIFGGDKHDER